MSEYVIVYHLEFVRRDADVCMYSLRDERAGIERQAVCHQNRYVPLGYCEYQFVQEDRRHLSPTLHASRRESAEMLKWLEKTHNTPRQCVTANYEA